MITAENVITGHLQDGGALLGRSSAGAPGFATWTFGYIAPVGPVIASFGGVSPRVSGMISAPDGAAPDYFNLAGQLCTPPFTSYPALVSPPYYSVSMPIFVLDGLSPTATGGIGIAINVVVTDVTATNLIFVAGNQQHANAGDTSFTYDWTAPAITANILGSLLSYTTLGGATVYAPSSHEPFALYADLVTQAI